MRRWPREGARAGAAASPEEQARQALKRVIGKLDRGARELALAGKVVRERTGSIGAEGVLALEVSDVAHRIRDLDSARPSPEPYPNGQRRCTTRRASPPRSQTPADKRPIDVLLAHLDSAVCFLDAAAKDTYSHLETNTPGEAGVLVEEVADVTHRAEGVVERRRRERDTETGQFFETREEAEPRRRAFLTRLLRWVGDG